MKAVILYLVPSTPHWVKIKIAQKDYEAYQALLVEVNLRSLEIVDKRIHLCIHSNYVMLIRCCLFQSDSNTLQKGRSNIKNDWTIWNCILRCHCIIWSMLILVQQGLNLISLSQILFACYSITSPLFSWIFLYFCSFVVSYCSIFCDAKPGTSWLICVQCFELLLLSMALMSHSWTFGSLIFT